MLIPWDKLHENEVLELQGAETVVELRDRLEALGGSAQHLSALIVHLPDGRAVPTVVAQVKELAKRHGRRILQKQLQELADELCPAPWELSDEPPDYRQAEMEAARRRLPIILMRGGRREGLIRRARQEVTSAPQRGTFDLFDRTVPERDQTDFVWVPVNATLIHVARTLAPLRDNPRVYVVRETGPGEYGAALKAELNAALERLAGETKLPEDQFWTLSLDRLQASFRSAGVLAAAEVSGQQATDLSTSKPLVLLDDEGVPDILYPGRILSGGGRGRGGVNLDTVALAALQHLPNTATPSAPEAAPRFVNLWFADAAQERLEKARALTLGKTYHLALQIGQLLAQSIIDWEQTPGGAKAIVEPQEKNAYLYVSVFSEDFHVPEPTKALQLPQKGETEVLHFEIEPQRRSRGRDDKAKLEVCVYYRAYLVQTFEVGVEVGADETARSKTPQTARLAHYRTASFPAMEQLAPRDLSLTITRAGPDGYRFTFLVDPDPDDPGAAEKAIKLACHVDLTRDELTHLITKARRQLYNVVRIYDLIEEKDAKASAKALRALAQVGRQLYLRLFKLKDAETLAQWLKTSLPAGSTIQIVNRAKDFVFPWSLIYTAPPWDEAAPLDVEPFWGWRYQLAVTTDDLVDTYRAAGEEIDTGEGLQAFFGLYERLAGADEQYDYFDRLGIEAIESRNEAVAALKQTAPHLVYFFCHGYTEKMANDIQLDDDLLREFIRLTADKQQSGDESTSEHLDDLFDVSDSWMRLSWSKLPLTMLREELQGTTLTAHPLVFLNMCQSAQVLPSLSGGLLPFFVEKGARAVIGTECSMDMRFGDRFARSFLDSFLDGQPAAKILWQLRQEGLRQGDPLALAYTLFGDADVRVRKSVVPGES